VLREEPRVDGVLSTLFAHFLDNPPENHCTDDLALSAMDHISGMTDRYALVFFERTLLPSPWP
jgi:dGTPase